MNEARKAIGRFNIIVAGRTGVGKTTLIGAIFGKEVGNTLMGRPRTRGRIWYPVSPGEADILRLCDTEGLEMERYKETLDGLKREIETRNASGDPFDHIHVAWLCIDEPSLTVQPGEEALVETAEPRGHSGHRRADQGRHGARFQGRRSRSCCRSANAVVRVRAAPIVIEGQSFPQMGLGELMQATEKRHPGRRRSGLACRLAQSGSHGCGAAETTVRRSAAAAGAAGATPIPLADAAGVFGVQVGMIISISLNMGVKLKRSDLQAMAMTLIGALGLTAGGRFIAGQFAKLIPGLGTIAGSAITGTTAAALTYGLGRAYLEYLRGFFEQHKRMPDADELVSGFRVFWRRWKNKQELPPRSQFLNIRFILGKLLQRHGQQERVLPMPKAMKIGYDALIEAARREIEEIEPERCHGRDGEGRRRHRRCARHPRDRARRAHSRLVPLPARHARILDRSGQPLFQARSSASPSASSSIARWTGARPSRRRPRRAWAWPMSLISRAASRRGKMRAARWKC